VICPWKRNTYCNFLVSLERAAHKVDISCGMQKTRIAQTIACRMTFCSLRPLRETRKIPRVVSLSTNISSRIVPTFDRHQIIKIVAASFLEISAFFYPKLRVVGLCKKVLQEHQKKELRQRFSLRQFLWFYASAVIPV